MVIIMIIVILIITITKCHIQSVHHIFHPDHTDRDEGPANREAGRCNDRCVCVRQGQTVPKYGGYDDDEDDDDDDDDDKIIMTEVF